SKGNGIDPIDIVEEYGADALRTYEMFIGDYELDTAWSMNGLKGCKRFLDRLWRIQEKVIDKNNYSKELETIIHKTIKKVTNDLENLKFNTAISALMTLLNEYENSFHITKADLEILLILLNPIAPHITEEINELQKFDKPICQKPWPIYDESKTINEEYELVIQVNGKVRGREMVSSNISEDEMKDIALTNESVSRYLEGNKIIKIITVPNKLVNIVVK
ncbi:MAG: class I tRNA ligase family protein, partial [Bacilli bacterium]|nr:class I tRNA ligase family protein [Bacilli bacterium]